MIIYSVYGIIMSILGLFQFVRLASKYKYIIYLFTGLIILFMAGFRYGTGTDYWNYYEIYKLIKIYGFNLWFEPGYVFLVKTIQIIGGNYFVFVFFMNVIFIACLLYILPTLTPLWLLSLVVYALSYMLNIEMGVLRFGLATVLTLFSIRYIHEKNFYVFLLIIMISVLLHRATILFLPMYIIADLKLDNKWYIIIFLFCIFIGMTNLVGNIVINLFYFLKPKLALFNNFNTKLEIYLIKKLQGELSLTSLVRKSVLFLYFLIFKNKVTKKFCFYNCYFNIVFIGYIIYFCLINTFPTLAIRVATMFSFYEILLLPLPLIAIRKNKVNFFVFYSFVIAISLSKYLITLNSWKNYFIPYKSIINIFS